MALYPVEEAAPVTPGLIRPGNSGSFEFGWPTGDDDRSITVWYDAPAHVSDARVLVVMTGRQRNGEQYRDEWRHAARHYGVLLIVPEISEDLFPGVAYNLGNVADEDGHLQPESEWAFAVVEPLFDAVVRDTGNSSEGYYLYGHSAGAQFVHRFVMFEPEARIVRAVSANAGWYTTLDDRVEFPYGLKNSPATTASVAHALRVPLTVLLGEDDDDPDSDGLRTTDDAMAQGDTRLERGEFFYASARYASRALGVALAWHLATVPGVGHDNGDMAPPAAELLFG